MIDVPAYSHFQCPCQCLENAFYLVVFILSLSLYVQVHARRVAQRLEEVVEHLGGHIADAFATEGGIPHQPRASAKVKAHLAQAVVHRQGITVTFNTPLAAQGLV